MLKEKKRTYILLFYGVNVSCCSRIIRNENKINKNTCELERIISLYKHIMNYCQKI